MTVFLSCSSLVSGLSYLQLSTFRFLSLPASLIQGSEVGSQTEGDPAPEQQRVSVLLGDCLKQKWVSLKGGVGCR